MRSSVLSLRTRTLGQVAAISLMAGLLAACGSDASKFGIPSITGSTNGQKAMVGGPQPMPPEPVGAQPAPYTPPVQRADIPAQQVLPGVAPTAAASPASIIGLRRRRGSRR